MRLADRAAPWHASRLPGGIRGCNDAVFAMLGDPRKLKTRRGYGYLVSWRDSGRGLSREQARALAQRLLDEPGNYEALLAGTGRQATREELLDWLAEELATGALRCVRTKRAPPVLDEPPVQDLQDLIVPTGPTEDRPQRSFIDLEIVGESGVPVRAGHAELGEAHARITSEPIIQEGQIYADFAAGPTGALAKLTELRWWAEAPPPKPGPRDTTPIVAPFEDLTFSFNSLVVLPAGAPDAEAGRAHARIGGLHVLAAVMRVCEESDRKLLVVGHTDTAGKHDYNLTLSQERAENVVMLLEGDRDGWAQACAAKHYKVDWKAILAWVHRVFGWDCDPGPINEVASKRSTAALRRFGERYEGIFGGSVPDEETAVERWAAYFDVYQRGLARLLETDDEGLDRLRESLDFVAPKALGCGELWPKHAPSRDDFACEENRRTDVWMFDPSDVPTVEGAEPVGAPLYELGSEYEPAYLPIEGGDDPLAFELAVIDPHGEALPNTAVRLLQGGAVFQDDITDSIGRVWVTPPGEGPVEVEVVGHDVFAGVGGEDEGENVTSSVPDAALGDILDGFVC